MSTDGDDATGTALEHLDVLVLGAGLSGIGAGRYLTTERPGTTFAILEARDASGGTWDLFRYPGIRSDSDLSTFGYEFKPWRDRQSIADAPKILAYLRETATENGLDAHIRYRRKVVAIAWSSADARWTVDVEHTDTGEVHQLIAGWVFCAGGYYRYDAGYTPDLPGLADFAGQVVHPQHWPADLDVTGKRVVVIGSGATAVTIAPSIAADAASVTILQRTPTYVLPVPREDALGAKLRRWFGDERGYALTRRKNIAQQRLIYKFCQRFPTRARKVIRSINVKQLPEGYDVDTHFNPPYDPWDQRLCAVPNGDLFRAIRAGDVEMVTDRIATVDPTGIALESGRHLDADVVVTATGLNVLVFGGIAITVDGEPVDLSDTLAFKGMMLSGVPNFAYAIGYTNSSWTLKVGLLCEHFTRLLAHMEATGQDTAVPVPANPDMPTRSFLDFGAGYVQRAIGGLPRQGDRKPWLTSMDYADDVALLRDADVTDPELRLTSSAALHDLVTASTGHGAGPTSTEETR